MRDAVKEKHLCSENPSGGWGVRIDEGTSRGPSGDRG